MVTYSILEIKPQMFYISMHSINNSSALNTVQNIFCILECVRMQIKINLSSVQKQLHTFGTT